MDVFSSLVLYLWIMQTKSPIIRNIFYPFKLNVIRIFTPTNNDSTIQTVAGPSSLFLQLPDMQLPKPAESTEASPGVGRSRTRPSRAPSPPSGALLIRLPSGQQPHRQQRLPQPDHPQHEDKTHTRTLRLPCKNKTVSRETIETFIQYGLQTTKWKCNIWK